MISSYGGVRRSKATASPTHQRQASPVHAVSTSTTTAAATEQAPAASEDEDEIDAGMISSYGGVRRSKATAPGTKTGASTKVRETTIVPAAQQAPLESDEEDIDFGMISSYGGVRRSKASAVGTSPTTGAAEGGTAVGAEDGSTAGESKVAEHVVPAPVSDDDEGDDLDAGMISSYGGVRRSKTTEQPVLQKSTAPPTVVSAEDKEAGGQPAEQVAAQNEANVETTQQEVPVEEDEEDLDAGMISSYAGVKRSKAGATA
ncbi:unnamed protein product [Amoebophrya sp. A120]|nr:unnamed protein product [Amoebophrya sp. A120]|eukprot:GSA120T00024673001.1